MSLFDLQKHTYSRKIEKYAYDRWFKAIGTRFELFWLNIHYAEGLLFTHQGWGD